MNLPSGQYRITATDARGAYRFDTLTIGMGAGLDLAIEAVPVQCGDTLGGQAAVSLSSALPPFSFLWQDGVTDSVRTDLIPGHYACTVTDARGCSAERTVFIGRSGNLEVAISITPITCPGAADGAITVQPANGREPYTWLWDDGTDTSVRTSLGPGQYVGTLTDWFGCNIPWVLPLDEPLPLGAVAEIRHATEPLATDGQIILSALSGGTPPYTLKWNTGFIGVLLDSVPPGIYRATMTDSRGCTWTGEWEVSFENGVGTLPSGSWKVMPNPAGTWVEVRLSPPPGTAWQAALYDSVGRVLRTAVAAASQNEIRWQLESLPHGLYWVVVQAEGRIGTKQVVVD